MACSSPTPAVPEQPGRHRLPLCGVSSRRRRHKTRRPPSWFTGSGTNVIPAAAGPSLDLAVTGATAANIDFADYLGGRLAVFFGAVLSLSFLLLMAVFRSLLVPLKAVIMNLLSIGAAYGIVVAIFQWGWLSSSSASAAGHRSNPSCR